MANRGLLTLVISLCLKTCCAEQELCRERYGKVFPPDLFQKRACTMCYVYLFPANTKPLTVAGRMVDSLRLVNPNNTIEGFGDVVFPTPANSSSLDAVCNTLSEDECHRWTACCRDGSACCQNQLQANQPKVGTECLHTWDGYSCWTTQSPGTTAIQGCPAFLPYSVSSSNSAKSCTANGTWFTKMGYEWTDYTSCMDKSSHLVGVNLCISLNVISIVFIIPAIVIFLAFRNLRQQNRVKVHIHLLIALGLCSFVTMLWYALVHRDLFTSLDMADTVISQNPVWCQVLAVLKLYLSSSTYWWMLCEGIYLHRLLVNAFHPPKSLAMFCVLGWGEHSVWLHLVLILFFFHSGCSAVCIVIYAAIRGPQSNTHCWAKNFGHFEWIVYAPNLLCLIVNMATLVNILRILLFKMHSHPHEPNSFRRGVKAAFMLIPLFGLQMLLTIYRPKLGFSWQTEYEYFTFIVTNSQGIFVAVIFCYLNGEVISNFRRLCSCCTCCGKSRRPSAVTNTSHFTMATEDTDYHDNGKYHPDNNMKGNGYEMEKLKEGKNTISMGNGDHGKYEPVPTML
ncbi:hypothetical protein CAPTEDRAFT_170147 [Capitella teleta]|uniref:G-protein coupled receptors family 2 profile 2 domain-containing protein n=1 Tax=Capitella teleta TaxID=283909 RepID=R7THN4_CAPTE|nr:hypothetical protein CAPTEDRAFT_170147 [Capitella teleta]|eukprot:ELT90620.1 hypothetical protein CAPTEDRAFT_170147 [Capitella teleta]